ncbi:hypothetical protein CTAYLR_006324 [Chrysophaeum taylorii]|uniref:SGNH hydrolase-type esterase domain-containing protein n=1 Tax=Chrysophaeum taylorii TaxID=2483200 RepID=A0AAD7UA25_9STRA|nr:hypothetical protein CTAYLR_006324 [Chrysophaeum taylorii]
MFLRMRPAMVTVVFAGSVAVLCRVSRHALAPQARSADPPTWVPVCEREECHEVRQAALPMCDTSGVCGESPSVATPRTVFSALVGKPQGAWSRQLERNKASGRSFRASSTPPLVLLGDSIFESLLGTSLGVPVERAAGVPVALEAYARGGYDPLPLAISGDQTQHLLWRMPLELPRWLLGAENATFLVLIGTNNLGAGFLPGPTAAGVLAVARWLLNNSKGVVAVLPLLPRGDGPMRLPRLCPPRCGPDGKPFTSFMPAVRKVNAALANADLPDLNVLRDCGAPFLNTTRNKNKGGEVNRDLMPDSLHPNAKGHTLIADCVLSSPPFGDQYRHRRRRRHHHR